MRVGQLFPLRLLGFGFYWAWLFLVTLSPSPLIDDTSVLGLPFEPCELALRLIFTILFFLLGTRLASEGGKALLVLIGCLGGPLATMLLLLHPASALAVVSAVGVGLVDAATFVLWLSFFGRMHFGGVALYMALSYCIGGVVSLSAQFLAAQAAIALAALLPAISCVSFYLADKLDASETARERHKPQPAAAAARWTGLQPYLVRTGIALACFAFMFGLISSQLFAGHGYTHLTGSAIESFDCLLLSAICGALMLSSKQTEDLYLLYKAVPSIMAAGIAAITLNLGGDATIGVALVMLGYLMFEITALNDYCIGARSQEQSLVKTFCIARMAITVGLLSGWVASAAIDASAAENPLAVACALGIVVIVVTSTVIFTLKEVFAARDVAAEQVAIDRDAIEQVAREDLFRETLARFSALYRLSERESDILEQLLRGRNVTYISEHLYIAAGTVKTHTHNIYSKLEVHSKMELLDRFEEFEASQGNGARGNGA